MIAMVAGHALAQPNPLVNLPVVGPLVALLDSAAVGLGLPQWLSEFGELVLTGVLVLVCLRLLLRRLLPWAGRVLARPAEWLVEAGCVVLLSPELLISRRLRASGRRLPEFIYYYGTIVLGASDGLRRFCQAMLPGLVIFRKIPSFALVVLLLVGFLVWNHDECSTSDGPACVSPVAQWMTSVTARAK